MEVQIDCPCGETYAFEIEPVDGKMPAEVNCPTCGADGTELSNQFIAEQTAKPSLRLQKEEPPAPEPSPPEFVKPTHVRRAQAATEEVPRASFLLGSFGAVIAGALGMGIWYILIKVTGYEIGFAAWGIGVLIGLATLLLGRGGSQILGLVAGACALVAIVGGQFLVVKTYVDDYLDAFIPAAYDEQMTFARNAVAANNDEELRFVLATAFVDYGESYHPSEITDDELALFRAEDLPDLQAFIDGTPSREEFEQSMRAFYNTPEMNWEMLADTFSFFTLLWLFLGVGSAYKIGRGADE